MKTFTLLFFALAGAIAAQSKTRAPAVLIQDGVASQIWIDASNKTTIRYVDNPRSANRIDAKISDVTAFIYTPPEFAAALEKFENRDYKQALEEFATTREKYKFTVDLVGNFSTLAGFYEMECSRILKDYEGLEARLEKFIPGPLALGAHQTQLEIYPFYNALRSEDWPRLKILCDEWDDKVAPTRIRSQIEYCKGLALEALGEKDEALMSFNRAFVVDYAASEVITRDAALGCFRIYSSMEEVELARKLYGTPNENPNSAGAFLLSEAAALVELWESALGRGEQLPPEFKAFSKYKKA